jgi:putative FmdB family regulatory protein
MPIYSYLCNSCGEKFQEEQPFGSPRTHACGACGAEAKRQPTSGQETSMATPTPGSCVSYTRENRKANAFMTKLRTKFGEKPIEDKDALAAERHMGRKSGAMKGKDTK